MNAYMHSSYLNCSSINKNLVVRNQDQNLIKIQGTAEGQSPDPTLHVFLIQNDLEIYPLQSLSLSVLLIKLPQSSNIYMANLGQPFGHFVLDSRWLDWHKRTGNAISSPTTYVEFLLLCDFLGMCSFGLILFCLKLLSSSNLLTLAS